VLTLSEAQDGEIEEAELQVESIPEKGFADEALAGEARADEDLVDQAGDGADEDADVQLFATRGQALLLSQQAELVIAAGRPACPNCGQPIDDFGHFCSPPATRTKWNSDYLQ
jgi:Protein of unknown function (DUF3090)